MDPALLKQYREDGYFVVRDLLGLDEVEAIWSAIDRDDDWQPLLDKVAAVRRMGQAHGTPPVPASRGTGDESEKAR